MGSHKGTTTIGGDDVEAVDDSIHRAAIEKHYPRFDHTLGVKWNRYLDRGAPIVDEIAEYYIRGNPA